MVLILRRFGDVLGLQVGDENWARVRRFVDEVAADVLGHRIDWMTLRKTSARVYFPPMAKPLRHIEGGFSSKNTDFLRTSMSTHPSPSGHCPTTSDFRPIPANGHLIRRKRMARAACSSWSS